MRKDHVKAIELRKRGKSYHEISKQLGIPKSTLSDWLRDLPWSQELRSKLNEKNSTKNPQRIKNLQTTLKKKWGTWHQQCREEAIKEFPVYRDNPLFVAGLMLYWGEGDKKLSNSVVRLSNSDPELIKIYYRFLTRILNVPVEKTTAHLILYPDLVDSVQKNFWSKISTIPLTQFRASTTIKGKQPKHRLSYGICIIQVSSRELKEKMIKWIELYHEYANVCFSELAKIS